jgi:hypothetical protein
MFRRKDDQLLEEAYQRIRSGKKKLVEASYFGGKEIEAPDSGPMSKEITYHPKRDRAIEILSSLGIQIKPDITEEEFDKVAKEKIINVVKSKGGSDEQAEHEYKDIKRKILLDMTSIDRGKWAELLDKVTRARVQLFNKAPFFEALLGKMKIVFTRDGIDTMAVDNSMNIYLNPEFTLEDLTILETVGVLAHEVMHIVNLTHARREDRDPELWNIATDYIMNRELLKDGFTLPKFGCLPYESGGRWLIKELEGKRDIKDLDVTDFDEEDLYRVLSEIALPPDQQQDQQQEEQPPLPIEEGQVIYDEDKGQYGIVTKVDKKTGKVYSTEIPELEVSKHLK